MTDADWELAFALNVSGIMRLTRARAAGDAGRAAEAGTAAVLNMASMASSVKGFPNRCAYGASKAAVIGLTKSIAADYVKTGLRCNALCPGDRRHAEPARPDRGAADPVQAEKDFVARQPMGRLATVEDIAPMVVYLLRTRAGSSPGRRCWSTAA